MKEAPRETSAQRRTRMVNEVIALRREPQRIKDARRAMANPVLTMEVFNRETRG